MPVCPNCDGEEFECADGLYYCMQCQTQSQTMQQEEVEEAAEAQVGAVRFGRVLRAAARTDSKKKKEKAEYGRPWKTCEGFTLVIKHQVAALIKLGASAQLEDVVKRLWTLYLSRTGQAFYEDAEEADKRTAPELKRFLRDRDKNLGSLRSPVIKAKRKSRSSAAVLKQMEQVVMKETLRGETFYEGDNPMETSDEEPEPEPSISARAGSESDEDGEDPESFSRPEESRSASRRGLVDRIDFMCMQFTLSFCHLGLLYTNNLVMPSDLIRWVKSGQVPYCWSIADIFPADMRLFGKDSLAFRRVAIPSEKKIRMSTGKLALFLGINELPQVCVPTLASKYIIELNLPAELHGMVHKLHGQRPVTVDYKDTPVEWRIPVPHYEALAMAYIVIMLKLLLGLDDHTERELSDYGLQLTEMLALEQPLFIWTEWVHHMECRTAIQKAQSWPETVNGVREVRDIKKVMAFHHQKFANQTKNPNMEKEQRLVRQHRNAMLRPFRILQQKTPRRKPSLAAHASTLHTSTGVEDCRASDDEDPLDEILGHFPVDLDDTTSKSSQRCPQGPTTSESSEQNSNMGFKNFQQCTLQYITMDEKFLDVLDNKGLSDFTIYSSCMEESDPSDGSDSDESDVSLNPSADLFERKPKRHREKDHHKVKKVRAKDIVKDMVGKRKDRGPAKGRKVNAKWVHDILQKVILARENYTLYQLYPGEKTPRHRSYEWLLLICSNHIGCQVDDLEKCIGKLQMVYLIAQDDLTATLRKVKTRFLRTFFKSPKEQLN